MQVIQPSLILPGQECSHKKKKNKKKKTFFPDIINYIQISFIILIIAIENQKEKENFSKKKFMGGLFL